MPWALFRNPEMFNSRIMLFPSMTKCVTNAKRVWEFRQKNGFGLNAQMDLLEFLGCFLRNKYDFKKRNAESRRQYVEKIVCRENTVE